MEGLRFREFFAILGFGATFLFATTASFFLGVAYSFFGVCGTSGFLIDRSNGPLQTLVGVYAYRTAKAKRPGLQIAN